MTGSAIFLLCQRQVDGRTGRTRSATARMAAASPTQTCKPEVVDKYFLFRSADFDPPGFLLENKVQDSLAVSASITSFDACTHLTCHVDATK